MNIGLLNSSKRRTIGWGPDNKKGLDVKTFKKFRPSEEYIDSLYDELLIYWEGLLTELPILRNDPMKMRFHEITDRANKNGTDHLLFWPIGQQMLAEIARKLLDKQRPDPGNPTSDTVRHALKGLSKLQWELHQTPWQYFLLIRTMTRTGKYRWAMQDAQRTKTVDCGSRIQQWILGLKDDRDRDFKAENLKREWKEFLTPAQSDETVDELWQQIEDRKSALSW